MHAGAYFEEAGDAAFDTNAPRGRRGDSGQELEQGRFSGSVFSHHTENLTLPHFDVQFPQGMKNSGVVFRIALAQHAAQVVAEGRQPKGSQAVLLGKVFDGYDGATHMVSITLRSVRRKTPYPIKNTSTDAPTEYSSAEGRKAPLPNTPKRSASSREVMGLANSKVRKRP